MAKIFEAARSLATKTAELALSMLYTDGSAQLQRCAHIISWTFYSIAQLASAHSLPPKKTEERQAAAHIAESGCSFRPVRAARDLFHCCAIAKSWAKVRGASMDSEFCAASGRLPGGPNARSLPHPLASWRQYRFRSRAPVFRAPRKGGAASVSLVVNSD